MATLFSKFQRFMKTRGKNPKFTKDPKRIQFEGHINRLFLYTSYNRLGKNAEEADAEAIIDLAAKTSLDDQEKQVQENIHLQVKAFTNAMDDILLPTFKKVGEETTSGSDSPRRSGLSLAVGKRSPRNQHSDMADTVPLSRVELSRRLKDRIGYTLDIKPSQILHKDAGQGLFLQGQADVGAVIAFYPGVTYSPAYYKFIPGYPKIDARNSHLIMRHDNIIINGQPWSHGGEHRELWDGVSSDSESVSYPNENGSTISDRFWAMLRKPTTGIPGKVCSEILERRNPLAFGNFANHPAEGTLPNVMVCPYDFPICDANMRPYIPNLVFGGGEVKMRRFGKFWFKSWSSADSEHVVPIIKSIVLVATRSICDEEIYLNYMLSNAKRRPAWYVPVDEEQDKLRWS